MVALTPRQPCRTIRYMQDDTEFIQDGTPLPVLLRAFILAVAIGLTLFVISCSNFPVDTRSAEQIKAERAAIKVICANVTAPGYSANQVQMLIDANVISDGSVATAKDCVTNFANIKVRPPAPAASGP